MKEPQWKTCTEAQLWKYVGWHLAKNGIKTVLVGGAVAAIYSDGIYKSGDLDFIVISYLSDLLPKIMLTIGFKKSAGRHYVHPKCRLFVEFASGPIGIGDDVNIRPKPVKVGKQTLYIYSPTDCIRDRLASYIHFRARECLDQAALVAKNFPFNHKKVKAWCLSEGAPTAYAELLTRIKASRL